MKLIIYTDGASRGNPGPAAYGFSIRDNSGKILYEDSCYIGVATNNFAEYSAVLNALGYAAKHFKGIEIIFLIDSKLVVEQLSGRFKIKSPNLGTLIHKIKDLESNQGQIIYQHIPREENKDADSLANQALDNRSG